MEGGNRVGLGGLILGLDPFAVERIAADDLLERGAVNRQRTGDEIEPVDIVRMPVGKADANAIHESGINLANERVGSAGGGMEERAPGIGERIIDAPTGAGGIEG